MLKGRSSQKLHLKAESLAEHAGFITIYNSCASFLSSVFACLREITGKNDFSKVVFKQKKHILYVEAPVTP